MSSWCVHGALVRCHGTAVLVISCGFTWFNEGSMGHSMDFHAAFMGFHGTFIGCHGTFMVFRVRSWDLHGSRTEFHGGDYSWRFRGGVCASMVL